MLGRARACARSSSRSRAIPRPGAVARRRGRARPGDAVADLERVPGPGHAGRARHPVVDAAGLQPAPARRRPVRGQARAAVPGRRLARPDLPRHPDGAGRAPPVRRGAVDAHRAVVGVDRRRDPGRASGGGHPAGRSSSSTAATSPAEVFAALWASEMLAMLGETDPARTSLVAYESVVDDPAGALGPVMERLRLPRPADLRRTFGPAVGHHPQGVGGAGQAGDRAHRAGSTGSTRPTGLEVLAVVARRRHHRLRRRPPPRPRRAGRDARPPARSLWADAARRNDGRAHSIVGATRSMSSRQCRGGSGSSSLADGHPHLGAADAAAVDQLHLAQLARRGAARAPAGPGRPASTTPRRRIP